MKIVIVMYRSALKIHITSIHSLKYKDTIFLNKFWVYKKPYTLYLNQIALPQLLQIELIFSWEIFNHDV